MTLGPNQSIDLLMTLKNARDFCGIHGASEELLDWLDKCIVRVKRASK
jgi:hypothetical protein